MLGARPDACSAKVCLNAGRITGGALVIQDWQGLNGCSDSMKANSFPTNPCQS
jgi:hypothetical protein